MHLFLIVLAAILVAHFIIRSNIVGGCLTLLLVLFLIGACARLLGSH